MTVSHARRFFAISYYLISSSVFTSLNGLGIDIQGKETSVNLLCFDDNQGIAIMSRMTRLSLKKLALAGSWADVAVLKDEGTPKLSDENITLTGKVGDVFNSFLNASFTLDPRHPYDGRYRCDATGYTSAGESVIVKSAELYLKTMPSKSPEACKRFQEYEATMTRNFQEILDVMKSSFSDSFLRLNATLDILLDKLDKKVTEEKKVDEKEVQEEKVEVSWPGGNFTLLMPDTGCPSKPPAWNKGFVKMSAEDNDRYYPLNAPKYMASPYSKDGFVYQQFCSLAVSIDRKGSWPAGSYCIQTFSGSCPSGFVMSKVVIDMKTDKTGNLEFGTFPTTKNFWADKLYYFCCRHDGSPDKPIKLPTSDPFYLYRHRGQCQKVSGMRVTQDLFVMATASDNNGGVWGTGSANYRPDLQIKPFVEELCYYSMQ